jgi:hypothetical protein
MQNLISMENCLIMTLKVDNKITKNSKSIIKKLTNENSISNIQNKD